MLLAFWSVQGGAGTTVIATTASLILAPSQPTGAVLADLTGDAPAILGAPEPQAPGLADWLAAGDNVPVDALTRMEVDATRGLSLLARGHGPLLPERASALGALLDRSHRPVITDCGNLARHRSCPAALAIARTASRSLLVLRPTHLALQEIGLSPIQPSGVILLSAPGRGPSLGDIEDATAAPVIAQIADDPAVANAVDAGLLRGKLPRTLAKGLRNAV